MRQQLNLLIFNQMYQKIKTIPFHQGRFERTRNKKQVYIICDDLARSNVCPYFASAVTSLLFHTSAKESFFVWSPFLSKLIEEIFLFNRKKDRFAKSSTFHLFILLIFCFGLDAGPTHPKPRALFIFWSGHHLISLCESANITQADSVVDCHLKHIHL